MSAKPAPRVPLVPLVAVLIGVAILCGLGVWQVQRLQWKTHLLARIAALQSAPPEPLAVVLNRIGDRGEVDYTHVVFTCPTLEQTPIERVYTVGDEGAGDRIVTACPLNAGPYRSILVDRGFLTAEDATKLKPSTTTINGPVVGVIRKGTPPNSLTPKHEPGGEWFSRDVPGLAAALHAPDPAPVFLFLESPKPKGFGPTPAPVPIDIPNNHLGYAITWFGLALSLVGVYIATLLSRRRKA
jgi:surfeit locus 1 family protein